MDSNFLPFQLGGINRIYFKNYLLLLASMIVLNLTGQVYPTPTTLSIISYPGAPIAPTYLNTITDATFGGKIIKISDAVVFNTTSQNLRHNYAKDQPWNADGSLIKLSGYPAAILDGNSFEFQKWLNPPNGEFLWANNDPLMLYGAHDNLFVKQNVTTEAMETIFSFDDADEVLLGNFEGNLSNDDKYIVIVKRSGGQRELVSFDIENKSVIATLDIGGRDLDWASYSQSGEFIIIQWGRTGSGTYRGVKVYDRNFNFLRHLTNLSPHGDLGFDSEGREVYVFYNSAPNTGSILSAELATGTITKQIGLSPGVWGGHISCRNTARPGYCYVSDEGHPNNPEDFQGYREIFAVKLDGSETVERFSYHHTDASRGFLHEAHAVPNRDGSKVLFASNWGANVAVPPSYIVSFASNTDCPSVVTEMTTFSNNTDIIKAENEIISTSTIDALSDITFQAGQSITLRTGFSVAAGGDFIAEIATCNNLSEQPAPIPNPPQGINGSARTIHHEWDIQVFPNITSDFFSLSFELPSATHIDISLFDIGGRPITTFLNTTLFPKGLTSLTFPVNQFPTGYYFVGLRSDRYTQFRKLFITK